MVTTTKNLITDISTKQEALQKFKKMQEDLQGVKRRLEEETAKTFNEVSATHKVVLEKRQRANELAASMERLEARLAAGSGWTDEQKEQKVRLLREAVACVLACCVYLYLHLCVCAFCMRLTGTPHCVAARRPSWKTHETRCGGRRRRNGRG